MHTKTKRNLSGVVSFAMTAVVVTGFLAMGSLASASSHREAPLISGDPKVDATDLYAFVSPDNKDTVTLIANYSPFEEPAGGPNFDSFDDNALYAINIDNNGDAKPDITYEFRFKTTRTDPNTYRYNTGPITSVNDPAWNAKQTYTLTKIENGTSTVLATDVPTPPVNIGPKSTPNYGALQAEAIHMLPGGGKVFAGQSDDPFFVDLGALFDNLNIRKLPGNAGGGINTTQGFNVHSLAIQVPITELTNNKSHPTDAADPAAIVGVWTTAYRHATRVLSEDGTQSNEGKWVQVSRLGSPLVNEVIVPVGKKDLFNASKPENDAQFAEKVANPELSMLLKSLYNVKVPPQGAFGSADQRDDLEAIFLTGIPGLTKPANVKPAEELRLNVAITPTSTPNNLGVLGGDTQGFPNGRRLADDVVDISIRAVAGAAYPLFHKDFVADPLASQLGDGVDANDLPFRSTFPYMALPNGGFESMPHSNSGIIAQLMATIDELKNQIKNLMGMGGGSGNGGGTGTGSTTNMGNGNGGSGMGTSTDNGNGSGMMPPPPVNPPMPPSNGGGSGNQTNGAMMTPSSITARSGTNVDFNGRNFGHEESVKVTMGGSTVGSAHADGGGNFSTGSMTIPSTPGMYTYTFTGQNSNSTAMVNVTVTE